LAFTPVKKQNRQKRQVWVFSRQPEISSPLPCKEETHMHLRNYFSGNIIFFVSIIVILLFGFPCHGFAQDYKTAMDEADAYLRNGQYLEAAGAYQGISERAPDPDMKARAILRIGNIYSYFLNNYDKALEKYDVIIKQYAGSVHAANAYFNSGMILYERNRYKEALDQFKMYVEKYPGGDRKETAAFMIETCSKLPPVTEEKKTVAKIPISENIRVLIMTGAQEVRIDASSPLEVKDINEKKLLTSVETAAIDIYQRRMRLNGARLAYEGLAIASPEDNIVVLNGHPYRGKVKIRKNPKGGLDVINIVNIEMYLYGVVPKEMSPQWFPEALKSQAVAARTFAIYQIDKSRDRDYDVTSTTASQVYGGAEAEAQQTNQAVDETKGMVIRYHGQLALTYFHGNSGGMTEDAERVWTAEIPYLKATPDEFSIKAPGCAWKLSMNIDDIKKALNKKGVDVGPIEKIVVSDLSPSGRVMKLRISHGGTDTTLSGNDFRLKTDPALIKSTLFSITPDGKEIHFEGKGYGHGVGMSQWGAYIMAREGRSYMDILQFFYKDVDIGPP
jgi:stage II sporulation protein D